MSMCLTSRQWVLVALAGLLFGCATPLPPPKPVISTPATNVQEEQLLKAAEKDYVEALRAMQGNKYDEAERLLKAMTEQYPKLAGPYANLGIVYANTKREKAAEQAFKKAIEVNPSLPQVYDQLGYFYRQSGRFQEARDAYAKAVELAPEYANAYFNLGVLNDLYLMDNEAALKAYTKYLELAKPERTDPVVKWIADLSKRVAVAKPVEAPAPAPVAETAAQPAPAKTDAEGGAK